MTDEHVDGLSAADLDLERRLEAYARVRLSPDPAAVARMRSRVMREVRLEFDLGRSIAAAAVAAPRRPFARRLLTPLLAAAVWLAIAVGTMAAVQPGGPLYPTRLWIEHAALPASPEARTSAEIAQLENRLAEVMAAAADGDRGAVLAALAAYRQQADSALAEAALDEARLAIISAALDRHLDVLSAVADQVAAKGNGQAASAIQANLERAIEHNSAVLQRLGSDAGSTGGAPAHPAATPEPAAGNEPTQEPAATAAPPSARPDKTPPGHDRP
jgi:hypothetical protein